MYLFRLDYCEHGFWGRACLYYKCGINDQGEVIPCDKIYPKIRKF